ncbi:MAG: Fe-S cluster assembly protein SufB, partial [Opitutus sp.]|nr:Fe-S cluster assembly protein SufB [Opitutus sp.]
MKPPSETDAVDAATENPVAGIDQSIGDFKYDVAYEFDAGTGLTENTVRYISSVKQEADW